MIIKTAGIISFVAVSTGYNVQKLTYTQNCYPVNMVKY